MFSNVFARSAGNAWGRQFIVTYFLNADISNKKNCLSNTKATSFRAQSWVV